MADGINVRLNGRKLFKMVLLKKGILLSVQLLETALCFSSNSLQIHTPMRPPLKDTLLNDLTVVPIKITPDNVNLLLSSVSESRATATTPSNTTSTTSESTTTNSTITNTLIKLKPSSTLLQSILFRKEYQGTGKKGVSGV